MASAFESATRVAISEIISKHGQESKFGVILTADGIRDLCDDLFDLLMTSRSLKTAGDKMLSGGAATASAQPRRVPTYR